MSILRIGVIGTENLHGFAYSAYINGWAPDIPVPARLPDGSFNPSIYAWATYVGAQRSENAITDARVTAVWSADPAAALLLAKGCGVEQVCSRPEEVSDEVDAVMVLSEPDAHSVHARPALERGLPVYVDKPFAFDLQSAREMVNIASQSGSGILSASAVRWSADLLTEREIVRQRGDLTAVHVTTARDLDRYGMHAIEMIDLFLGAEVEKVQAIGGSSRQVALLTFVDGRTASFECLPFLQAPILALTAYGSRWSRQVQVSDGQQSQFELVRHFIDFARGAPAEVTTFDSLQLVGILAAARQALMSGETVRVADIERNEGGD